MGEGSGVAASLERRLQLGIPGLDEIFLGGLIPGRSYLLSGQPGAGKTVFAFQWLRELHIGPDGFSVGGKLDQLHGVMTGVPSWHPPAQHAE